MYRFRDGEIDFSGFDDAESWCRLWADVIIASATDVELLFGPESLPLPDNRDITAGSPEYCANEEVVVVVVTEGLRYGEIILLSVLSVAAAAATTEDDETSVPRWADEDDLALLLWWWWCADERCGDWRGSTFKVSSSSNLS